MTKLEETFFEEYKRLDRLCAERLGVKNGVSAYIARIERSKRFPEELKTLKRLRWLRNRIAHENGSSGCEKADLAALRAFAARVGRGEDPVSTMKGSPAPAAAALILLGLAAAAAYYFFLR